MHWYLDVLKKYVTFSGRARRTEYWMFTLISTIIIVVLAVVDHLIGTDTGPTRNGGHFTYNVGLLRGSYGLLVLLPSLAVQFRRLHDTDRARLHTSNGDFTQVLRRVKPPSITLT